MSKRFHTTASGHRIEYEATPKVDAFLRRLSELVADTSVSAQGMIGIAYSSENPILDHKMFPGRGAVTRDVLDDPAYAVVTDLLFRKQLAEDGTDIEKIAAKYSMTVPEAAAELGMSTSAVRQAIAAKRIGSWLKGGQHYLNPKALTSLEVGTRNPIGARPKTAPAGGALEVSMGSKEGFSFSVRGPAPLSNSERVGSIRRGSIEQWKRVVIRSTGDDGSKRAWVIVPAAEQNELAHGAGDFYVRGRFAIEAKSNNPRAADDLWKATVPE